MATIRLVLLRKNCVTSPQLSRVPCKMLSIRSIETARLQRVQAQLAAISRDRPVLFDILEKLVKRGCERREDLQKLG